MQAPRPSKMLLGALPADVGVAPGLCAIPADRSQLSESSRSATFTIRGVSCATGGPMDS